MDYASIIKALKENRLNTESFKRALTIAKPLSGRTQFRASKLSDLNYDTRVRMIDIESKAKNPDGIEKLISDIERELKFYFDKLVTAMKECAAWKLTGLVAKDYDPERFKALPVTERISMLEELNRKYKKFLDTQQVADLRDCILSLKSLNKDEEKIRKLCFLKLMFKAFKNPLLTQEFYIFDPKFLITLVEYRRDKKFKDSMEAYFATKSKALQFYLKDNSKYFTQEDFRDIAENIDLASKTTKISLKSVIGAYAEMSETEAEKNYLDNDYRNIQKLRKIYVKAFEAKMKVDEENAKKLKQEMALKKELERKQKLKLIAEKRKKEAEKKKKEEEKKERDRVIGKEEGNTGKMEKKISEIQKTPTAKEKINPIILTWLERDDVLLSKRIGVRKFNAFFERIKRIEAESGFRVSLFIITNSGRDVTVKRLKEIQDKAKEAGLPRLVEGALGGYSSFKVDNEMNITDVAKMSPENRKKIMLLLSKSIYPVLTLDAIQADEVEYLRYQFTDKKDKSIDKEYLNRIVNRIKKDPRVSKQPLRFLPYMEDEKAGIDVVLESQIKGVSQILEYYRFKYHIEPGKTMKISIDDIEDFIYPDKNKDREEH